MAHTHIGYIKIELLGGVSIEEAAKGMVAFATRIGMPVEADFNGVILCADPDGNATLLVSDYHKQQNSDRRVKRAFSTP